MLVGSLQGTSTCEPRHRLTNDQRDVDGPDPEVELVASAVAELEWDTPLRCCQLLLPLFPAEAPEERTCRSAGERVGVTAPNLNRAGATIRYCRQCRGTQHSGT